MHAQLLAQGTANEGWRTWASFFMGGLYAPVASSYLFSREEWNAGASKRATPIAPPSTRGVVVLGLFCGVPVMALVGLFMVNAMSSVWVDPSSGVPRMVRGAQSAAFLNLFVAWFYVLSVLLARQMDRRFSLLLFEVTGGSRAAMRRMRRGRVGRGVAMAVSCLPFVIVAVCVMTMRTAGWSPLLDSMGGFYALTSFAAAFLTSVLHMGTYNRFQAALRSVTP